MLSHCDCWKFNLTGGFFIFLFMVVDRGIIFICSTDRCNCYFSFWAIFCPFTPLTAQKIKILRKWKNEKKHLEISSFYICVVSKNMVRYCTVPEIWCAMDRQTDGWKKWHIEVGVPPKKHISEAPVACL